MVEILSPLQEIIKSNDKKADGQPDTTDMSELESEEFAEQRRDQQGKGLKNFNIKPNVQQSTN